VSAEALMQQQMDRLVVDVSEIKSTLKELSSSMERVARLEERHTNNSDAISRAFAKLEDHDSRMMRLETEAPLTRMVRRWVIAGVIGVAGVVGIQTTAFLLFFYDGKLP